MHIKFKGGIIVSEVIADEFKYIASIRFENTKKPYTFGTNIETLEYGNWVVVETARGLELGEMISSLRDRSAFSGQTQLKAILRLASDQDKKMYEENKKLAKEAIRLCSECIQKHNLDMNLINCEYTLDRSKVIFVYVSENRVDFRELLKDLTQSFKCRIELRQIGPRDKAKMVGGVGACGLETCCSRFLNNFDVVSINMAKNQLLPLNIPKLSGQCGKLMCCLKYEDQQYKEMRQGLPKMNSQIEFEGKMYRLASLNVITRQCKIENKENAVYLTIEQLMEKGKFNKVTMDASIQVKSEEKAPKVKVKKEEKAHEDKVDNDGVIADNVKEFSIGQPQEIKSNKEKQHNNKKRHHNKNKKQQHANHQQKNNHKPKPKGN